MKVLEVICKKEYIRLFNDGTSLLSLIKCKKYKIRNIDLQTGFYNIKVEYGDLLYVNPDFFYTKKELRKLKLKKIK